LANVDALISTLPPDSSSKILRFGEINETMSPARRLKNSSSSDWSSLSEAVRPTASAKTAP